jgi:hypothetical protein
MLCVEIIGKNMHEVETACSMCPLGICDPEHYDAFCQYLLDKEQADDQGD